MSLLTFGMLFGVFKCIPQIYITLARIGNIMCVHEY